MCVFVRTYQILCLKAVFFIVQKRYFEKEREEVDTRSLRQLCCGVLLEEMQRNKPVTKEEIETKCLCVCSYE